MERLKLSDLPAVGAELGGGKTEPEAWQNAYENMEKSTEGRGE